MKLALAQINTTVGDISGNVQKMLQFAADAQKQNADLVIFPELSICGYPPNDLLLKESFVQANLAGLETLCQSLPKGIAALVGYVDVNTGKGRPLFNASALIVDGQVRARQFKTLLPTYDVFDEDRYFEPAKLYSTCELNGTKLGLSICEDIWNDNKLYPRPRYQIDPIERLVEQKAEILINISASPFSLGKEHLRHELVRHQAIFHNRPVVYVNQVGGNDQLIFDGRSIVVSADGVLIGRAKAFEEDLLIVDLKTGVGEVKASPEDRDCNAYEALVLGTRDYMQKCGFKQALIGLSGGIDSAIVAAIACAAVGSENVFGVAMPSPYSSIGSVEDAKALAQNLGVELSVIEIEKTMKAYDQALEPAFKGLTKDVTEENLQARIRGTILMSLSNKFNRLVLTTGNKSELAVGYCTLYGDMCGGLAVISDVPKTMVYDVAKYINRLAGKSVIPESTMTKPPSAELRPGQKDQDTLPPYVVLDGIMHAYVEQHKSPAEIVKLGYASRVVMDVIRRIDSSEYKRNQAAPGLKISDRAFGMGWRMPIAHKFKETIKLDNPGGIQLLC